MFLSVLVCSVAVSVEKLVLVGEGEHFVVYTARRHSCCSSTVLCCTFLVRLLPPGTSSALFAPVLLSACCLLCAPLLPLTLGFFPLHNAFWGAPFS